MHADRPQKARARALERFRSGAIQVLVATDVMSRGIDIQGIDAVINFDVPLDPEDMFTALAEQAVQEPQVRLSLLWDQMRSRRSEKLSILQNRSFLHGSTWLFL